MAAPFVNVGTATLLRDDEATDIDPASNAVSSGGTIVGNIDDALVRPIGTSMVQFTPVLATDWSTNADQSVWTFHLRHGVRFHTGRCCMTAEDVRYSLGRTVAAGLTMSYMLGRFFTGNPLKQIKTIDPYTVEFALGRPQPAFLKALGSLFTPYILDAQALKAHATTSDPYAHNWATAHDLGTGPYMLQSWQRGQQAVLVRFPGYWGGWSGRHFSKVVIREIPNAVTRRELLERGQADLTYNLTPEDYDALKANPAIRVIAPVGTEIVYVAMTEAGPLAPPAARQALSYAFPYGGYIRGVMRGYARRSYGPLPSALVGYDAHTFHYQTDLAKAKALLKQAGITPGTTLTYASYRDNLMEPGLLLQAQLAQLGLALKLQRLSEDAFNAIFYGSEPPAKRPNLMAYAWYPDYSDPYDEVVPLIASAAAGANGANAGYYHNAQVDALIKQMKTASGDALVSAAHRLQDLTGRLDPPSIWVSEPLEVTVAARSLEGFVPNPLAVRLYYFYGLSR
ncbi:MAG: ABC transporter substrate-binding protein [Solirubrobacterales bacterium]|nr:ABC transporter substrate-binding protein [Solirubrobacterales bacterium]